MCPNFNQIQDFELEIARFVFFPIKFFSQLVRWQAAGSSGDNKTPY